MRDGRFSVIAYTKQGGKLAEALLGGLRLRGYEGTGYLYEKYAQPGLLPFHKPDDVISQCFAAHSPLLFICAMGIAVRKTAPYVSSKRTDAPVLVMDEQGKFVIPVLSGHIGGANFFARLCAGITGATAVITTATDVCGRFSVDEFAKYNRLAISDMELAKKMSAFVVNGVSAAESGGTEIGGTEALGTEIGEREALGTEAGGTALRVCVGLEEAAALAEPAQPEVELVPPELLPAWLESASSVMPVCAPLLITPYTHEERRDILRLVPGQVTLGIGCRRGTVFSRIESAVRHVLERNRIDIHAVCRICSADIKKEEQGLLVLAEKLNAEFCTFSAAQLSGLEGDFSASAFVREVTGVDNVCERSAVAGSGGRLIVKKTVCGGVTVAAAIVPAQVDFDYLPSGWR